jgi:hypothetical protein
MGTADHAPHEPTHAPSALVDERAFTGWLSRLHRRWRLVAGLEAGARALAATAVLVLAAWSIERFAAPSGIAIVLLLLVTPASAAGFTAWMFRHVWRRPSQVQLARYAEERTAASDDLLVTAADRLHLQPRGLLDGLIVRSAAARVETLDPREVVGREPLRRGLVKAGLAVVALGLCTWLAGPPAWRALQTARLYLFPPELTLEVTPGNARIASGSDLRIVARLQGLPAGAAIEVPRLRILTGPQPRAEAMKGRDGRYVASLPRVARSFRYQVVAGRLASPEFVVTALDAARVQRIDVEYAFPSFTKLPPRTESDSGDIYGPAGTKVRLRVHTDKPVAGGALALRDGTMVPLAGTSHRDNEVEAAFTLERDGAYRVSLRDRDGLTSAGDTEYFIRLMDDRPPDVRVMRPAGDRQVTRLEEIVIEARADDDHGIQALDLVYAVRGGKERAVPLYRGGIPAANAGRGGVTNTAGAAGGTSITGAHTLFVEELDVEPGDFITYYARARDISRGKRASEARSDIFFLEVRPFGEEFVAATSQSMRMGAGGGGPADLLESQKEIIVATWKLQRRTNAGQSADDIRAVGRAQGELRARAAGLGAMLAGMGGRRRSGTQGDPAQDATGPLQRAEAAMGKAESALNALQPGEAIPHEMEAYNHLLRLQSEVTRRQVARQRGGGGGGGRSGTQDLSALFDRELLRQQETNYETRNSVETRDKGQSTDSSALEKLRELARRQDDIAQRQRELAKSRPSLPPDEVKRRLDRLTREQDELRQETEQLSKQMSQSGENADGKQDSQSARGGEQQSDGQGSPGQGQGGKQGESNAGQPAGSQGLHDAAQEMGRAAQEMSRSNLEQAQSRADQSLARLRDLERRLSGERGPDEQRRALGELQLEAQQLADAQRRLATEARNAQQSQANASAPNRPSQSAAGSGRTSSADAFRRMAAEQERLAERAQALGRGLEQFRDVGAPKEAARAVDAARDELGRQRLADQMRQAASALRAGQPSGNQPGAGQNNDATRRAADQVDRAAQAAAQVAVRLGASVAGSAETRRLSEQLTRLRELRDRMASLERQIREQAQRADSASAPAEGQQAGRTPQTGANADRSAKQQGSGGQGGAGQPGSASQEQIRRLQAEYDKALAETRSLVNEAGRESGGDMGRSTPEHHEFSRSAPGTEAFKQDYAKWEVLSKDVTHALEQVEASLARRLSERNAKDRVNSGGDDKAPAQYSESVSRYYRSLAKKPEK